VETITSTDELRAQVRAWRREGLLVGLVPTMGFLHEGHESLIKKASLQNHRVVVSVFVNPMQFDNANDLSTYPRSEERDNEICEQAGAHVVFRPSVEEMYPPGFCSYVDMDGITDQLCGATRPGHFRGVCTVVAKLFCMVQPDAAYFGQKDAQQLAVIRRMATDLNMGIKVVGCPIVRESDGLAMSSRNTHLSKDERKASLCLSQALSSAQEMLDQGEREVAKIVNHMRERFDQEPLARIDYVSIVDAENLQPVEQVEAPVLVALAVFIGNTRLIDNFVFEGK
jgi:pantoate--beta-alanine ligase